ncbi:MAG: Hsp20/alpha crystallin family protein [Planctomycetes bacterium]|nr:Hsp20/alpha crystallin family protein [Planctomycetota bacterium]
MLPTLFRETERSPLFGLRNRIDRVFEELFTHQGNGNEWVDPWAGGANFLPALDLRETDDALIAEVELPGLKSEDVHVQVQDDMLVLRGERKQEKTLEDQGLAPDGAQLRPLRAPDRPAELGRCREDRGVVQGRDAHRHDAARGERETEDHPRQGPLKWFAALRRLVAADPLTAIGARAAAASRAAARARIAAFAPRRTRRRWRRRRRSRAGAGTGRPAPSPGRPRATARRRTAR